MHKNINIICSLLTEVNYQLFLGFVYNDGITAEKQFTNLRFNEGDILSLKFDYLTKIIRLSIMGKQFAVANFKINFWEDKSFRFAILLQGPNT